MCCFLPSLTLRIKFSGNYLTPPKAPFNYPPNLKIRVSLFIPPQITALKPPELPKARTVRVRSSGAFEERVLSVPGRTPARSTRTRQQEYWMLTSRKDEMLPDAPCWTFFTTVDACVITRYCCYKSLLNCYSPERVLSKAPGEFVKKIPLRGISARIALVY